MCRFKFTVNHSFLVLTAFNEFQFKHNTNTKVHFKKLIRKCSKWKTLHHYDKMFWLVSMDFAMWLLWYSFELLSGFFLSDWKILHPQVFVAQVPSSMRVFGIFHLFYGPAGQHACRLNLNSVKRLKVCAQKLLIVSLTVYKRIKHGKQSWTTEVCCITTTSLRSWKWYSYLYIAHNRI